MLQQLTLSRVIPSQFLAFSVIGVVGFLVDATVLTALVNGMDAGLYIARGVSFPLAVTTTWYLNRRWTFSTQKNARKDAEYGRYTIVQIIGALLNLGIYSVCIEANTTMAAYPVVPLAIGAVVALFFNFFAASFFAFRKRQPQASC